MAMKREKELLPPVNFFAETLRVALDERDVSQADEACLPGDARHRGAETCWKSPLLAWLAVAALLLAGAPVVRSQAITPQNQIPLFNGSSLGGLYPWFSTSGFSDPNQVFGVENGMLHATGNGWGALTTNGRYRNYVMVLEFKWGSKTWGSRLGLAKDSGLLFHGNGVEGGWNGLLMPSIQAQMIDGGIGDVILLPGVDGHGATLPMSVTSRIEQVASGVNPPNWNYRGGYRWKAGNNPVTSTHNVDSIHWSGWDPNWQDVSGFRGQTALESPDGMWNQMVVIAKNDTFEIYLNGTKINEGSSVVPAEGKIQLEVEFAEFFVRRWELWPLGHAVGPVITMDQLPGGVAGTSYHQVVRAAGGSALTWRVAAGNLPTGLALNSATGQITGTPTASGSFSFNVRVTDTGGEQANQAFQVVISDAGGALVTTGLVLHLDSTQGVTTTGGTVSAWADLSGQGNHVVAVGNPQLGTVPTPLGLPSIHLDGVDDSLQRTGTLTRFPGGHADRSIFLVAKYNSSTWWAGVAYGTAANNQSFGLNVKHATGELVLHGYGSGNDLVSSAPGIGAGWMVQSGIVSGSTATHFKNGTPIGQFTHNYDTVPGKLVVGAEIGNAGFAGMDVAALLIYDRALNDGERADVEAYLQNRYLTDTVPPLITVPAGVIAEATGSSGAVVNFTTSAIDNASGNRATTNTPASGSVFPLGLATVAVSATDSAGNIGTASFTVTVRDTTGPSGGTMTLTPGSRVDAAALLGVTFQGWTDPLAPLACAVLVDDLAVNAASNSMTVNFTGPTAAGAHTLKGRIYDTPGNVTEVTGSFTVNTPIESWRYNFYGTTANTGNAADLADPYDTGIQNLVAFALLDPNQNPREASARQLPQLQMSGGNLLFSFTQPTGVSGITYGAEWSTTLLNDWQAIIDSGIGGNHIFSVPIAGDTRMFMRFKITSP